MEFLINEKYKMKLIDEELSNYSNLSEIDIRKLLLEVGSGYCSEFHFIDQLEFLQSLLYDRFEIVFQLEVESISRYDINKNYIIIWTDYDYDDSNYSDLKEFIKSHVYFFIDREIWIYTKDNKDHSVTYKHVENMNTKYEIYEAYSDKWVDLLKSQLV